MTSDRPRRVAEAIKAELADLIAREVKDPRVREGLVSVTHVEVNRDLSVAEVGVSILVGDPKGVVAGLEKAAGFLRGPLARRLKLRISPELRFHHDRSQELAGRLHEIVRDDEERRRAADGEQETGDGQPAAGDGQSEGAGE
ncbi:MAG TPA: 30S ribosome-binding factor RbfA [Kofleriaceae bacterium]|nr:30S ribosome-binding factor RbfA [Kofleriaceae bacterium]